MCVCGGRRIFIALSLICNKYKAFSIELSNKVSTNDILKSLK